MTGPRRAEHGQAAVEFAFVAPILLVFIMLIVDAGFFAYSYISVTNAVREGARCGAVGGTDAAVEARVTDTSGGLTNVLTVDPPTRGNTIGSDIIVTAHYTYAWITPVGLIPGLSLDDIVYSKSATMRMETEPPYTKAAC
jgi:TadE-like protein